jgi:hypothetical protein
MEVWGTQLLELALKLQTLPLDSNMESTIAEMQDLSNTLIKGEDANGDNRIEPIPGEGGADTAYIFAYAMSDMPILPGPKRMPPPGQKTEP